MTWLEIIRRRKTRLGYAWQKFTDRQWMWGHPDEWSEAEWFYYRKERK
jgi:hypothetical protein